MSSPIELSSAEQQAYETITTEDELHQSELWKRMDVSSRKSSRIDQMNLPSNYRNIEFEDDGESQRVGVGEVYDPAVDAPVGIACSRLSTSWCL